MPLGVMQRNNFVHMSLDIWNDKVFYEGRAFPAGYFASSIMDLSEESIRILLSFGGTPTFLFPSVIQGSDKEATELFPLLREQIMDLAEVVWQCPPFCYNDKEKDLERIKELFDDNALPKIRVKDSEFQQDFRTFFAAITRIPFAIFNFIVAARFFELDYLRRLGRRTETDFAVAAVDCFNSEQFWEDVQALQSFEMERFSISPQLSSSYVIARNQNDEKEMMFVNRVTFVRVVDFYTYDLLNGLHHGHAPSQCQNCGKFFLTTNGHKPKYCNGVAPQNDQMTCRQYGAMMHQKEKNKQHPIYRLHSTRTNTIRKHHQRGKISDELRREAIYVTDQYRDKALMDNDYAANGYAQDMAQENIYEEARKRLQ